VFTFIARFRRFFLFAGVFSLVINLLLIVPAVYMLQVFDRAMMSRSQERQSRGPIPLGRSAVRL
jgi:ABC-type protease/lipase transport system fused ATPase/permease subunit